jgi:hypothetical protein
MTHFLKNLTIMGGLFVLGAFGAGRFSLDARGRQTEEEAHPEVHEDHRVLAG